MVAKVHWTPHNLVNTLAHRQLVLQKLLLLLDYFHLESLGRWGFWSISSLETDRRHDDSGGEGCFENDLHPLPLFEKSKVPQSSLYSPYSTASKDSAASAVSHWGSLNSRTKTKGETES